MKTLLKILFSLLFVIPSFAQTNSKGFLMKVDTAYFVALRNSLNTSTDLKEGGRVRADINKRVQSADLIKIPIASLAYRTSFAGSGTVFATYSLLSNGDGSGQGVTLTTGSAGLGTNRASVYTSVWGKTVGVRFRRRSDTPPFAVIIDGTPYPVPTYLLTTRYQNESGADDRECLFIVAEDLKQGFHSVEVILYPSATQVNQLVFYGFVADKYAGYVDPIPTDIPTEKGALPTTSTSITKPIGTNGLKKIWYSNTSGAEITVSVTFETVTVFQKKIAANDTYILDVSGLGLMIPPAAATTAALAHSASASGVNYFLICR